MAEMVRGAGVGKRLVRRLVIALAGRAVRRAIGLSKEMLLSSSAIFTRREEPGVPGEGNESAKVGLLRGVAGPCSVLATGRLKDDLIGVAVPERADGGGESIEERLRALRTGIDDCADVLFSGVAASGL